MSSKRVVALRAAAAADIAARKAHVTTLLGMLAAKRRERTNFKARLARKHKRHVVESKKYFVVFSKTKPTIAVSGRKAVMSTGGWAPIPFAHYDAEFQLKMRGIKRDIAVAKAGVREAMAARKAIV